MFHIYVSLLHSHLCKNMEMNFDLSLSVSSKSFTGFIVHMAIDQHLIPLLHTKTAALALSSPRKWYHRRCWSTAKSDKSPVWVDSVRSLIVYIRFLGGQIWHFRMFSFLRLHGNWVKICYLQIGLTKNVKFIPSVGVPYVSKTRMLLITSWAQLHFLWFCQNHICFLVQ
jgi:hypothetical protein